MQKMEEGVDGAGGPQRKHGCVAVAMTADCDPHPHAPLRQNRPACALWPRASGRGKDSPTPAPGRLEPAPPCSPSAAPRSPFGSGHWLRLSGRSAGRPHPLRHAVIWQRAQCYLQGACQPQDMECGAESWTTHRGGHRARWGLWLNPSFLAAGGQAVAEWAHGSTRWRGVLRVTAGLPPAALCPPPLSTPVASAPTSLALFEGHFSSS